MARSTDSRWCSRFWNVVWEKRRRNTGKTQNIDRWMKKWEICGRFYWKDRRATCENISEATGNSIPSIFRILSNDWYWKFTKPEFLDNSGTFILHDNALPHTSKVWTENFHECGWEVLQPTVLTRLLQTLTSTRIEKPSVRTSFFMPWWSLCSRYPNHSSDELRRGIWWNSKAAQSLELGNWEEWRLHWRIVKIFSQKN